MSLLKPTAAFMILMSAVGAAAEQPINCATAVNTYDMQVCANQELDAADKLLNEVYRATLADIAKHEGDPPYDAKSYEAAFRAAQRAWIAYRDAECNGVVPFEWGGGTGRLTAVIGCLTAKTVARTKELKESFGAQ
jgi:uncharacterized protein YecT (DUF1311 family)